jgi:ligand-binding sensor domain-containing protein
VLLKSFNLFAQYPQYFKYDDASGLPSNEVYSLAQDSRGFIWLGSDAGLLKFDGVRYIPYKSATQKSKSIAGLTLSSSGRLYCDNFQSQIFYVEKDSLIELLHSFVGISHIECDYSGKLYVNHQKGIAVYDETHNSWENFDGFGIENALYHKDFTKSARVNKNNEVSFLSSAGVGVITNNILTVIAANFFSKQLVGDYVLEWHNDEQWIFSVNTKVVYRIKNGNTELISDKKLMEVLQGRKITSIQSLADGMLWICTYNGVVRYNTKSGEVKLYYPEIAFSDCILDREGNYWLSTLQTGVMRIPNLNFTVWNVQNEHLKNDKLTKLTTDSNYIYFSSINGTIGQLNTTTYDIKSYTTPYEADVQSLDYNHRDQCVYFNINNHLYSIKDRTISEKTSVISSIKTIKSVGDDYCIGSSFGTFIQSGFDFESAKKSDFWSREIAFDSLNKVIWVATNEGLNRFENHTNEWQLKSIWFPQTQVLSVDFDYVSQLLYAVTFNGKLYSISIVGNQKLIAELPENIQSYKLKYYQNKLFLATNKGVWIYDIEKGTWKSLNVLSGLASDNVQDILVLENNLWLASGKGLQKIPFSETQDKPLALVYLKNEQIYASPIQLNYGAPLVLFPEVSNYSSNGNFEYEYRINNGEWINLPATIDKIEIQNIPSGNFTIELKVLDYLQRPSENTLLITGYVYPPIWQTWWFFAIIIVLIVALSFIIGKKIVIYYSKKRTRKNSFNQFRTNCIKSSNESTFYVQCLEFHTSINS